MKQWTHQSLNEQIISTHEKKFNTPFIPGFYAGEVCQFCTTSGTYLKYKILKTPYISHWLENPKPPQTH